MLSKTEDDIRRTWNVEADFFPLVTIRCLAYNHALFIEKTLDGFLMQETSFPFEIVVHDDASTDGTAAIIESYQKKYPSIIKALYEKENLYSKGDGSLARVMDSFMRGKYIALCEGDDYWTDKMKLQMQIDALEEHKDYMASGCGFIVKEDNKPDCDYTIYKAGQESFVFGIEDYGKNWYLKTLTCVYRKEVFDYVASKCYQYKKDVTFQYHALKNGNGIYFCKPMGVYNIHSGGVWSAVSELRKVKGDLNTFREIYIKNDRDRTIRPIYLARLESMLRLEKGISEKFSYLLEALMCAPDMAHKRHFISVFIGSVSCKKNQTYSFGKQLSFAEKGHDTALQHCLSGFSTPEYTHTWTDGMTAEMKFVLKRKKPQNLLLNLEYSTFNGKQRVKLYANDVLIADYVADGDEVKTLALPNEVVQNRALLFRFELPDAVSPLTLGISADSRALALAMRSISIFQKRHDY